MRAKKAAYKSVSLNCISVPPEDAIRLQLEINEIQISRAEFLRYVEEQGYPRPTFWDGSEPTALATTTEPLRKEDRIAIKQKLKAQVMRDLWRLNDSQTDLLRKQWAYIAKQRRAAKTPATRPPSLTVVSPQTPNLKPRKRGRKRKEESVEATNRLEAALNTDPALYARLPKMPEKEVGKICGCDKRHIIRAARAYVLNKPTTK